jgi:hypothetical protein
MFAAIGLFVLLACGGDTGDASVRSSTSADSAVSGDLAAESAAVPLPSKAPPRLPPPDARDSLLALAAAPDSLLDRLATLEYGYEERGLIVHDTADGWLLVVTADSAREWIRASLVDSLYPLAQLVVDRLNYLTGAWDGTLREQPDVTAPPVAAGRLWRAAPPDAGETPAHVVRAEDRDGTLWFEVEVRSSTGCDGETPSARATGWVPAYGARREPTVWFYSRGC